MQYPPQRGRVTPQRFDRQQQFRERVRETVVDQVPPETAWETDSIVPFRYDTSIPTIIAEVLPHCDGSLHHHAVYVLECRRKASLSDALSRPISTRSATKYTGISDSRRVLYVGKSRNILQRLDEHLNSPGRDGAQFTGLHPPLRVLHIGWFVASEYARKAEAITAELLEERFPKDFVAYPG